MAKAIQGSEVIVPKHLAEAISQVEAYIKSLLEADKVITKIKENSKSILKGSTGNTVNDIKAVTTAYKDSNSAVQAKILLDRQLRDAQDEVVKGKLRLRQATIDQNKILKEEIALEDKQIGTLKKLSIENAKLKREREGLNLKTKEGAKDLERINAQLDKNNAIIKKSSDLLTKQRMNVGNYQSALKGLNSTLTQFGIGLSAFVIMKDAIKTVVDFEKATASLSAITGATGQDLEKLKGNVMDLATTMKISATDSTKLFEIVGSQMPQLLKDAAGLQEVAESAVTLSKASGDTVEESTRALANVMNQFSLGADQAERTMNILAAGSLVGSAGINDVSEAMKNFGSVAAGANISVEESVALIEVLGKFGVTGAESGTKLRGSILKLQQASFGYASGQFEVNDALDEAKKKMESYGTALEQDAFLQKTFGAENISTGRILLANIGLFEEYTKGVTGTNVATEQAAINSDTMATVVKELGAAWDNWVIGISEGSGALDFLKPVLRFIAENLETIMTWLMKGVAAWGAARLATKLYRTEIDATGKSIKTGLIPALMGMFTAMKSGDGIAAKFGSAIKSIGLGGFIGALTIVLPMIWDLGKGLYEAFNRTTALDKVTEKYNKQIDQERAKLDLLKPKFLAALGDKSKMKELIDETNIAYGTTLENLEDETAMLAQLEAAYKSVNLQMERRIKGQLIEEELVEQFRRKREIERDIKEGFAVWDIAGEATASAALQQVKDDISELNRELFSLNQTAGIISGKASDRPAQVGDLTDTVRSDGKDGVGKIPVEFKFPEPEELKDQVDEGWDSFLDAWNARKNGEITIDPEDDIVDMRIGDIIAEQEIKIESAEEIAAREKQLDEEAAARRKKLAEDSINLAKKVTDAMLAEIERRKAIQQTEIAASENRIDYLREEAKLGNTDAAESIKAEEIKKANQKLELDQLERKKKALLATVTTLELASLLINQGDTNGMQTAGNELSQLLAKIPKFYEGTEGTVAQALGRPHFNSGKDAYLARVDGTEMIHGAQQSAKLQAAGFSTTSDIAQAALAYSGGVTSAHQRAGMRHDESLVSGLEKAFEKAISKIDIPGYSVDYNQQTQFITETVTTKTKVEKNHFKQGGLFS